MSVARLQSKIDHHYKLTRLAVIRGRLTAKGAKEFMRAYLESTIIVEHARIRKNLEDKVQVEAAAEADWLKDKDE